MRLRGCFITPEQDSQGDRFNVDGVDYSDLRVVTMEDFETAIGTVISIKREGDRILGVVDVDSSHEHLYVGKKMFFGVGGHTLERDKDLIVRCRLNCVALTPRGVHQDYLVHPGAR